MRLEYTVIGEAVNLAGKIEKANKELGTAALCDAATYTLALEQGYQPPKPKPQRSRVALPGLDDPIEVVRLRA